MKKVDIVYFDAGSGHRSSAKGLERAVAAAGPDLRVRMVNIVDVFAPNKQFHRIVCAGVNHFNRQLTREKVFDLKGLINLSLMFHDLLSARGIREISEFWKDEPPDVVVSVTPMYNPALYRAARLANPRACCVTIPVDFEEAKPRYWFTPKVEQHYLLATARLEQQARDARIPNSFIHRISGMPIDPEFYEVPCMNVEEELARLGLDPVLPTGFVSFGGQGSVKLTEIARSVALSTLKLNLVFLCGKYSEVYKELTELKTPYPKLVLGYTRETPIYYQRLAQFIIGKPGSMTITEALIAKKTVIAIKSRGMWPVQRGNEEWVEEHKVGIVVSKMEALPDAIQQVITSNDCQELASPSQQLYLEELRKRYSYVRQFAPRLLETFALRAVIPNEPLLKAVNYLRDRNQSGQRGLDENAPLDFVPAKWKPLVCPGGATKGTVDRAVWEICLLSELSQALKSGNVHVPHSRAFQPVETYLIERAQWEVEKTQYAGQLPLDYEAHWPPLKALLSEQLRWLDEGYPNNPHLRLTDGELHLDRLEKGVTPESAQALKNRLRQMLDRRHLSDLLLEVQHWTNFLSGFTRLNSGRPITEEDTAEKVKLLTCLIAEGCNIICCWPPSCVGIRFICRLASRNSAPMALRRKKKTSGFSRRCCVITSAFTDNTALISDVMRRFHPRKNSATDRQLPTRGS